MNNSILLITPPLTQLNTPYPATAVLKGFLQENGRTVFQADLGIELIDSIFSTVGLEKIFNMCTTLNLDGIDRKTVAMKPFYLNSIEPVKEFLRGKNPALAYKICGREYLPEGPRFRNMIDLESNFGPHSLTDKAKYLATLYIEDIADLIRNYIHPGFDLIRYQQQLAQTAPEFEPIYQSLFQPQTNIIDETLLTLLNIHLKETNPKIVGFTVPFPGNVFGALICAKHIKSTHPNIKIVLGGGYITTELRELTDPRIFEFVDYMVFDDGEKPFLQLLGYFDGKIGEEDLVNTMALKNQQVFWFHNPTISHIPFSETGTPDFTGLPLHLYFSLVENVNPMHKLWTDGYWNKMTLAHGCYWAKCAFCDTSLDYIQRFDSTTAVTIIAKMKAIIQQTGQTGFHFTDEAAPPALLKNLAIEILKEGLSITWWGNIRFEKTFTADLCRLLAASGCIAVTGGIETASDRLLQLMNKGVSLEQAAQVTQNFSKAGILVHAYLMFGFPSQTQQETIDSLEVVRQFFEKGLIQSAFWHRFALTCHSPVGKNPDKFGITLNRNLKGTFANNELIFHDPVAQNQPDYSFGLTKATYNFMHKIAFETPVQKWFDFKVPAPNIPPKLISHYLKNKNHRNIESKQLTWIGGETTTAINGESAKIFFNNPKASKSIDLSVNEAKWVHEFIEKTSYKNDVKITFSEMDQDFLTKFNHELTSTPWFPIIRECGLLLV
ncbi:MAG: radical SAM protein [Salinivirgaceae bacterium]